MARHATRWWKASISRPTFVEVAGGRAEHLDHVLEGHSLLPFLRAGDAGPVRDEVICEYDFSGIPLADRLDLDTREARMFMVATRSWKMIHFESGDRPMLFDLENDPGELVDLGADPDMADVISDLYDRLLRWACRPAARTTIPRETLCGMRRKAPRTGVLIGVVDEDEIAPEFTARYRNRKAPDKRPRQPPDDR